MATNSVNANYGGERIYVRKFTAAHLANDLVYEQGWFGVVEDDVVAGGKGYIICHGSWKFPRCPSVVAAGTKLFAFPTSQATTLQLQASIAAAVAVGRVSATGNASLIAEVVLFSPNESY